MAAANTTSVLMGEGDAWMTLMVCLFARHRRSFAVRAAGDEYELQKAAFTNDGTTPIAELSAEQRQKLNRLYHKYGNEFQRALHEQICSRYGLAGDQVTDDMRTGQPAPPENAEDFDYDLLHMEHVSRYVCLRVCTADLAGTGYRGIRAA